MCLFIIDGAVVDLQTHQEAGGVAHPRGVPGGGHRGYPVRLLGARGREENLTEVGQTQRTCRLLKDKKTRCIKVMVGNWYLWYVIL